MWNEIASSQDASQTLPKEALVEKEYAPVCNPHVVHLMYNRLTGSFILLWWSIKTGITGWLNRNLLKE
jgi:hypothetical protein